MNLDYVRLNIMIQFPNYDPRPDLVFLNERIDKIEESQKLIIEALKKLIGEKNSDLETIYRKQSK